MCGFAGWFDSSRSTPRDRLRSVVALMNDTLRHRGPDSSGDWVAAELSLAIGHRRLAILDLTPAGHQPMLTPDGRFVLSFNGEIYNHATVREELSALGWTFRGHSDTETLLYAIASWGATAALQRFVGMFAIAVADVQKGELTLARDRLGEKPLYYGWAGSAFVFGSELKSLRAHPQFSNRLSNTALSLYLNHNYIPGPLSVYEGIFKLDPGTCLTLNLKDLRPGALPTPEPYWRLADHVLPREDLPSEETALSELDRLLRDAVKGQMMADVPLGAFLSGGIDSSLIVAMMQEQSSRPVKTFTIGFEQENFNEAKYARRIADHLRTDHTEMIVSGAEALAVIPKLPTIYDEPFSDSSQIPTCLVSALARKSVTVSLSGDAGDELFSGYPRYSHAERIWKKLARIPRPARSLISRTIDFTPQPVFNAGAAALRPVFSSGMLRSGFPDYMRRLSGMLNAGTVDHIYHDLICRHRVRDLLPNFDNGTTLRTLRDFISEATGRQRMMAFDTVHYLPDDILVKVDRAAMAVSLETRVPLLDHRVVEFAFGLPMELKYKNGQPKWVLRKLLSRRVRLEMFERPKMGFGVPMGEWLRGPLREWGEDLLSVQALRDTGVLNPPAVRRRWEEHIGGQSEDWSYRLWDILMLQAWLKTARA
jgi:asparagine synthase (glutamine-hydrolysing)